MSEKIVRAAKPEEIGRANEKVAAAAPVASPKYLTARPTKTVPLAFPLEWGGKEYHEVTFHRPTGMDFEHLREMTAKGIPDTVAMHVIVTDLPVEVVQALDAEDFAAIAEVAPDFIPARFRTVA